MRDSFFVAEFIRRWSRLYAQQPSFVHRKISIARQIDQLDLPYEVRERTIGLYDVLTEIEVHRRKIDRQAWLFSLPQTMMSFLLLQVWRWPLRSVFLAPVAQFVVILVLHKVWQLIFTFILWSRWEEQAGPKTKRHVIEHFPDQSAFHVSWELIVERDQVLAHVLTGIHRS